MKFIIGKKIEMTQIFQESGRVLPVTKIQAGPCTAIQIKSVEKDGYQAVQFGYGEKKQKNINKPQIKHFKNLGNFQHVKEMRIKDSEQKEMKVGDFVDVESFVEGDKIKVTGTSKGRGFQGVVKRHGFSGFRATHGNKDQLRMPGSIGAKGPAHVFKGMRMGGHMGDEQVTVSNLEVVKIDQAQNIIYVKGAVPGARNGLVLITGEGELKIKNKAAVNNEKVETKEEKENDRKDAETTEEITIKTKEEESVDKTETLVNDADNKQAPKQENKEEQNSPASETK